MHYTTLVYSTVYYWIHDAGIACIPCYTVWFILDFKHICFSHVLQELMVGRMVVLRIIWRWGRSFWPQDSWLMLYLTSMLLSVSTGSFYMFFTECSFDVSSVSRFIHSYIYLFIWFNYQTVTPKITWHTIGEQLCT